MNWDEKAEDYAGAHHTYEHRTPEDNRLIEKGIVNGARWQHDQLRTDDAVERVARAIHDDECACGDLNNDQYGDDGTRYYLDKARAAIAALIGEEP